MIIGRLAVFLDQEVDLWVRFDSWIDHTGAGLEVIVLRLWVIEGEWGCSRLDGEKKKKAEKVVHRNDTRENGISLQDGIYRLREVLGFLKYAL